MDVLTFKIYHSNKKKASVRSDGSLFCGMIDGM